MARLARKSASLWGVILIGDAIAHFIDPEGHARVWSWHKGPGWYNQGVKSLSHSKLLSALELALGLGLTALARRSC